MGDKVLERMSVEITGDLSKLRRSSAEAVKEVQRMTGKINAELKTVQSPKITVEMSKSISQIERMNQMIRKSFFSMDVPKGIAAGIKNYVRDAQIAAGIRVYTDDYLELSEDIERTSKELERLKEQKRALSGDEIREETEDYQELSKCISKTQGKLNQLIARQDKLKASGMKENSKVWKNLQYDIDEAKNTLQAFEIDAQNMRSDGSAWQESKQWREVTASIAQAERQLRSYQARQANMEASGTDTTFAADGGKARNAVRTAGAVAGQATGRIKEIIQQIPLIGKAARSTSGIVKKAFAGMLSAMKSIGPAIKQAGGAFASLIKRFASGIPGISKLHNAFHKTGTYGQRLGGIFRTIGMSAKFMLASFLIRGTLTGISEGMQNLAQYSDQTNASLSRLMSGLTQLKNSFATAFAPILNTVAPALDFLIQKVASAVSMVGILMASLTGQKAFIAAKKVNQDYAASLNNNAASADKANEANKKLQRTILGFDEINRLEDNQESPAGSGGASAPGIDPSDMFEEIQISGKISEFAEKLKEAWRKADFTEIGSIAGEKLNGALENIPWGKIKGTLNRIAKSTATFLNGFLREADWTLVGNTLAEGVNTAFEGAGTFAEHFDWSLFGKSVGTGLNGALNGLNWETINSTVRNVAGGLVRSLNNFIQTADWNAVGRTILSLFNLKLSVLYTAVRDFGWADLGQSLGDLLNGAVSEIDSDMLADTMSGLLNGVSDAIRNFDETIEWGELSEKLYRSINRFFRMTNWTGLGENLSSLMTHLLDEIQNTIEGTDWEEVGRSIGDFLVGIDWIGVLDRVAEVIKSTAKALPQVALGIVDAIKEGISSMTAEDWASVADSLFTIFTAAIAAKAILHGPKIAAAMIGSKVKDAFKKPAQELGESMAKNAYEKFTSKWNTLSKETQTSNGMFGTVGGAGVNAGFSVLATELGKDILDEINGTAEKSREIDQAFMVIQKALANTTLETGFLKFELQEVAAPMSHLYKENAPEFSSAFQQVIEKFEATGRSSQELKDALKIALGDGTQISQEYADEIRRYIGESEETVNNLSEAYTRLPQKVTTEMDLKTREALEKANGYEISLIGIPSMVTTEVQADTEEATGKVNLFQSLAEKLGLTKVRTYFEAVTQKASENIQKLSGETDLVTGLKKLILKADANDAEQKTASVSEKLDGVKTKSSMKLDIDTSEASSGLDLFTMLKLLVMKTLLGSMVLSLDTKKATEKINSFQGLLNNMGTEHTVVFLGNDDDIQEKIQTVSENVANLVSEKVIQFRADLSDFYGINDTMYQMGFEAAKSFKSGLQSVYIPTPHMYVSGWNYHDLGNGGYFHTPNYSIQWYRSGGFPSGEIWGMNESGNPEMVGRVGNRTAVANNAIIAEAIKDAVVDGMMEVFLATRMNSDGGESQPPTVEVVVKADDETLYRRVMKGKKKADRRYSVTATV